ncbi:hypothetical protein [Geobacillus sp. TFV-3]|uniref:hypothetical protein n=1 Tax=Geobacillus sp. TFV-3 TaxID=1897059 RepID=UPI00135A4169|nr:hypothetical protein [Geobacillus sp. TFV-3]KAF0995642.1 hypothetical protein BJQ97_02304 [Geobacillus sp. TFV-3]
MDIQLPALQSVMPKTPDAERLQASTQQHSYAVQAQMAAAGEKRSERARRRVTDKRTSARLEQEASHFGGHPYKGKTIDIQG